ncbi:MAG: carboxyltransferase domain-containing protein [Enterobacteriaceae bacterium]|nr:carboxyltransferase domain-containing protein [Enterobacteriaceae bacterium]
MSDSELRYTFGGDEHLFIEVSEAMSLKAFFRSLSLTNAIKNLALPGVLDICLANASCQIRFNPDILPPLTLLDKIQAIEEHTDVTKTLSTRIIEMPVLYNDPWTHETLMRFRERHQDPQSTDLEYATRLNGLPDVETFIAQHSGAPWFVSMVGFVAGLPFMYQMVEQERQIQVPKYLTPRTDTPQLSLGHGGCFGCIYSVRGAGGYQLFGITPAPIYDTQQRLPYLKNSMVFFRTGDIVQFRPIDRNEYDQIITQVERGEFTLRIRPVEFDLSAFEADPQSCTAYLQEILYGN